MLGPRHCMSPWQSVSIQTNSVHVQSLFQESVIANPEIKAALKALAWLPNNQLTAHTHKVA